MVFISQLNTKSAKYLAEILPKLKSLESIDLEGNPIEAKGALYLLGDSKKLKRWGFRLVCFGYFHILDLRSATAVSTRAPKNVEKNSLFFIFVDEFQKIIRCFLFPLIFSTNSTNQRNQRKFQRINENSQKIFEFVEILFEIGRCFENCH